VFPAVIGNVQGPHALGRRATRRGILSEHVPPVPLTALARRTRTVRVVITRHDVHVPTLHNADALLRQMRKRRQLQVAAIRAMRPHLVHIRFVRTLSLDKASVHVRMRCQVIACLSS